MPPNADATTDLDRLIATKREQIARYADDLAADMLKLARAARERHHVKGTPIGSEPMYLNTLCGELSALIEARDVVAADRL